MNTKHNTHILTREGSILPPPLINVNFGISASFRTPIHALLHSVHVRVSRAFLCLALSSLFITFFSCEKEVLRYQEMVAYHAESLNLSSAAADSVARFSQKVTSFVRQHPAAAEDPLYPEIKKNIQQCWLRLNINIDDEWDGENDINF